ncbi:hypothetical protein H4582DRAFT_2070435 [Lactarius indigo]|nr:hypothetical protein H4582DRAFT_2070435 [Lactarius indigo]
MRIAKRLRADAGAILTKWNSVREHDRDDLGLPNISRQGRGLWTHESTQYSTHSEAATLLPHRVLTVSEASGLVIDVQVYNPLEIEAKDSSMRMFQSLNLSTEGAGGTNIALRKMLSEPSPAVPGPRYFCANRAIVPTGSYGASSSSSYLPSCVHTAYSEVRTDLSIAHRLLPQGPKDLKRGIDGMTGADVADGLAGHQQAMLRTQIGADVYSSASRLGRVPEPLPDPLARSADVSDTYAHYQSDARYRPPRWRQGYRASPGRVDRGDDHKSLRNSKAFSTDSSTVPTPGSHILTRCCSSKLGTVWVPTLSTFYTLGGAVGTLGERVCYCAARWLCVRGHTGVFEHEDNALKLRLGAECTSGPGLPMGYSWWLASHELHEDARVVGDNDFPFTVLRKGFAADIIAISEDGRRVYKLNGKEIPVS